MIDNENLKPSIIECLKQAMTYDEEEEKIRRNQLSREWELIWKPRLDRLQILLAKKLVDYRCEKII